MRSWQKIATLATAIAVGGGATVAWAQAGPGGGDNNGVPVAATTAQGGRALGAGVTGDHYVGLTPCRIVDTRLGGGPIAAGATRGFHVRGSGSNFTAQGGKASGCGIPNAATSIEATITAVNASGAGYLRAWPSASPEPTATFLNYIAAFNPTNTGAVRLGCLSLCALGSPDLLVKTYANATQVVIDVQGYFEAPLAAVVNSDGTLARGSQVVSSKATATGDYLVTFDRDISTCAFVAVPGETTNLGSVTGAATTATSLAGNTKVFVRTTNPAGTNTPLPFHLIVTC